MRGLSVLLAVSLGLFTCNPFDERQPQQRPSMASEAAMTSETAVDSAAAMPMAPLRSAYEASFTALNGDRESGAVDGQALDDEIRARWTPEAEAALQYLIDYLDAVRAGGDPFARPLPERAPIEDALSGIAYFAPSETIRKQSIETLLTPPYEPTCEPSCGEQAFRHALKKYLLTDVAFSHLLETLLKSLSRSVGFGDDLGSATSLAQNCLLMRCAAEVYLQEVVKVAVTLNGGWLAQALLVSFELMGVIEKAAADEQGNLAACIVHQNGGACDVCGGKDEACCGGVARCRTGLRCQTGEEGQRCLECGGVAQPCCEALTDAGGCGGNLQCQRAGTKSQCIECGGVDQPCCSNFSCAEGLLCSLEIPGEDPLMQGRCSSCDREGARCCLDDEYYCAAGFDCVAKSIGGAYTFICRDSTLPCGNPGEVCCFLPGNFQNYCNAGSYCLEQIETPGFPTCLSAG
jgi:hypothetical protein